MVDIKKRKNNKYKKKKKICVEKGDDGKIHRVTVDI